MGGKITPLTSAARTKVLTEVQKKSSQALRCIGLAYKNATGDLATFDGDRNHPGHKILQSNDSFAQIESGLVFVGFLVMLNRLRVYPTLVENSSDCLNRNRRLCWPKINNKDFVSQGLNPNTSNNL